MLEFIELTLAQKSVNESGLGNKSGKWTWKEKLLIVQEGFLNFFILRISKYTDQDFKNLIILVNKFERLYFYSIRNKKFILADWWSLQQWQI